MTYAEMITQIKTLKVQGNAVLTPLGVYPNTDEEWHRTACNLALLAIIGEVCAALLKFDEFRRLWCNAHDIVHDPVRHHIPPELEAQLNAATKLMDGITNGT